MDLQQIAETTDQLRGAVAALSQIPPDLPAPTLELVDTGTREALEAIYRAREALSLPSVAHSKGPYTDTKAAASNSRLPSRRTEAARRTKSDRIARDNDAFFHQLNLRPNPDLLQQHASVEDIA